jgi:hypothetical protein
VRKTLLAIVLGFAFPALAADAYRPLPNTTILSLKLGFYQPRVGDSAGLVAGPDGVIPDPYVQTFGNSAMLIGQVEVDRSFWHGYGYLGIGLSIGYGEKYAKALLEDGVTPSAEATGLMVLPIRMMAVYRFDVLAHQFHIPLVPYAELGFVSYPWWTNKGGSVEEVTGPNGVQKGSGVQWGWGFTVGLALEMDFLNPTYAREAREDSGIFHFYLFGEVNDDYVNGFGGNGINLSSVYWTFGLAFEF